MQRLKQIIMIGLTVALFWGGMISAASAERTRRIVLFEDGVCDEERNRYASEWEAQGATTLMRLPFINSLVLSVPEEITTDQLADDYRVASVEEDQPVELQSIIASGEGGAGEGGAGEGGATTFIIPSDELPKNDCPYGVLNVFDLPYNPSKISDTYRSDLLHEIVNKARKSKRLHNVKMAIFDTGVDADHSVLFDKKTLIQGGIDLTRMIETIPMDDNGHGTHVAGTLIGKNLGIAREVKLYVVKMLDEKAMGDLSSIIMGLQWAVDKDVDIINMSFGFREDNPVVHKAIQKAHEAGVIMVAAAGNHSNWLDDMEGAGEGGAGEGGAGEGGAATFGAEENPYEIMYPAAYPEVIAVGAHDSFGEIAAFSNTGPELDIFAPGTRVHSANVGKGFGICSGTSMASPHVAGAVALMLTLDEDKTLSPGRVKRILQETSIDGNVNLVGALEDVYYGN